MERKELLEDLQGIMEDVFDVKNLHITDNTVAADIEEWDSLNYVHLIVEIQKRYKVKFTAKEIQGFKNVGDICNAIENRP